MNIDELSSRPWHSNFRDRIVTYERSMTGEHDPQCDQTIPNSVVEEVNVYDIQHISFTKTYEYKPSKTGDSRKDETGLAIFSSHRNMIFIYIFTPAQVDPEGHYVRRWLPELRHLPTEYIHCPWESWLGHSSLHRRMSFDISVHLEISSFIATRFEKWGRCLKTDPATQEAPAGTRISAQVLVNGTYWQRVIEEGKRMGKMTRWQDDKMRKHDKMTRTQSDRDQTDQMWLRARTWSLPGFSTKGRAWGLDPFEDVGWKKKWWQTTKRPHFWYCTSWHQISFFEVFQM